MFRSIGDFFAETAQFLSLQPDLSPRTRQHELLKALSFIFRKSIDSLQSDVENSSLTNLNLLLPTKLGTVLDGFPKTIEISEDAMKKCLLPYLARHHEIIELDFTFAIVWEKTLFALAGDFNYKHNTVSTVYLTRLFRGKATLDPTESGWYWDTDMVKASGLNTIYRINPHYPDFSEFTNVVNELFKYNPPPSPDSGTILEATEEIKTSELNWNTLRTVYSWHVRMVSVPLSRGALPVKT